MGDEPTVLEEHRLPDPEGLPPAPKQGRRLACRILVLCSVCLAAVVGFAEVFREWALTASLGAEGGYSDARATTFARLAGAAYCSPASLLDWKCGENCIQDVQGPVWVCGGETTQAYVARFEGQGLVAFQGTKTLWAMLQDLRLYKEPTSWAPCAGCFVHTGFLVEWETMRGCIEDALLATGSSRGSSLRVTGHSLGGATASLAMIGLTLQGWHISEAYTFGQPRIGGANFSSAFAKVVDSSSIYRVTHHMDPVPHVPPYDFGFVHTAPEIFYDANFTSHVDCSGPEDSTCAGQYYDLPMDFFHIEDHLDYMGVSTGSAGCEDPASPSQGDAKSTAGTTSGDDVLSDGSGAASASIQV